MRGLKGPSKLVVVAMTAATLLLVAAVGASAASGTFGSAKVLKSVVTLLSPSSVGVTNNAAQHSSKADQSGDGNGKGKDKCIDEDGGHQNATGGHENDPCDDEGGGGGGGD